MKKILLLLVILLNISSVSALQILSPQNKTYGSTEDFYYDYMVNKTVKEVYVSIDGADEFESTPFLLMGCNGTTVQDFSYYNQTFETTENCVNNKVIINSNNEYAIDNTTEGFENSFYTTHEKFSYHFTDLKLNYKGGYGALLRWQKNAYDGIRYFFNFMATHVGASFEWWYPTTYLDVYPFEYHIGNNESVNFDAPDVHYFSNLSLITGVKDGTNYIVYPEQKVNIGYSGARGNFSSFTFFNESNHFSLTEDGNHNLTIRIIYNDTSEESDTVYFENDLTPPVLTEISSPDLQYNSEGYQEYLYLLCDESGIANFTFGDNLKPYMFTAFLHNHTSNPSYNSSWRMPPTNKSIDGMRNNERGEAKELENFIRKEYGANDIWSWGNAERLEIYFENETCIKINASFPDVHLLLAQYFNLDRTETLQENTENQFISINKNNIVMIKYNLTHHNFSYENFTSYNHYNIDFSDATFDTPSYRCNESYILDGFGDYIVSPNCQLFREFTSDDLRTITIYNNSFFHADSNYEEGYFGNIKLSYTMLEIFDNKVVSPIANMPKFYFNNNSLADSNINFRETETFYYSNDRGDSWNLIEATPNFFYTYAHLDNIDVAQRYSRDCDKWGNCINHTIFNDTLEEFIQAPPIHFIINPSENEVFYNDTNYSIEWIKGGYFYDYNTSVYLINASNSSDYQVLCGNLSKSIYLCTYDFSFEDIGAYQINLTSYNEYGEVFSLVNFSVGVRPPPHKPRIEIIDTDFGTEFNIFENGTFVQSLKSNEKFILENPDLNYTFQVKPNKLLIANQPSMAFRIIELFVGAIFGCVLIIGLIILLIKLILRK